MILNFKKRRHKPLYKNFISLRKNVQNRRRLNLLKFYKKKWKNLISYLKRSQLRRKKNFEIYDINRYFLPKVYNKFKRKFSYTLQTKKKFKLFYGGMLKKHVKTLIKLAVRLCRRFSNDSVNLNTFFLSVIESRLDVVIYRSHFVLSIKSARQLILHKHVKVNGIFVKDYSYLLKKGDLIEIDLSKRKVIEVNLKNSHIWPLPPKYLIINYKTFQIIFNNNILDYQTFSTIFPFWLDLSTIIRFYK